MATIKDLSRIDQKRRELAGVYNNLRKQLITNGGKFKVGDIVMLLDDEDAPSPSIGIPLQIYGVEIYDFDECFGYTVGNVNGSPRWQFKEHQLRLLTDIDKATLEAKKEEDKQNKTIGYAVDPLFNIEEESEDEPLP